MVTPDGVMYQISSHRSRLINKDGKVIEDGVPVDKEMLLRDENGDLVTKTHNIPNSFSGIQETEIPVYDSFYDFEAISRFMDEFYKDRALPEAA